MTFAGGRANEAPPDLPAVSPRGRHVTVKAVQRGRPLRFLSSGIGPNSWTDVALLAGLNAAATVMPMILSGWTVGVVSDDTEPWAGQRVLHRERCRGDVRRRLAELKVAVDSGSLEIPQPRRWNFRRKP